MNTKDSTFGRLIQFFHLERKEITAIYFYAISSGLIQLSLPLGVQSIIGFVQGASMITSIYVLIFLIVLGILLVGLLQINQMKIIEYIQQKVFVNFAIAYAEKIPRLDLKEIDNHYLPEKINRFFETQIIQKGLSKMLLDIPIASIQILFGLILLSLYHPLFIIFSFILVAAIALVFRLSASKGLETSIAESNFKYSVVAWFEEMGRVIKSFKYSQGTDLNLIKTDESLHRYVQARTAHFKVLLFQYRSLVLFKVSITALMLILGTYLLIEQKINIGQFVAAEIVILVIINSLEKLIISLENIYDVITGLKKLYAILDLADENDGSIDFKAKELKIEINNMSFGYTENGNVFQNISLTILPNTVTCITGPENSGKSTLLKLLTGSYREFKGSIQFNDLPIQRFTLQSLRSNTGLILSEQEIFHGTLYENIVLGKNHIGSDEILLVAKSLNIDNMMSAFPQSFETILDPIGIKLPSSTILKILLLRALVHDPILLILEEPWRGLDEASKITIQNFLLNAANRKTIIISTEDLDFAKKSHVHIDLSRKI